MNNKDRLITQTRNTIEKIKEEIKKNKNNNYYPEILRFLQILKAEFKNFPFEEFNEKNIEELIRIFIIQREKNDPYTTKKKLVNQLEGLIRAIERTK